MKMRNTIFNSLCKRITPTIIYPLRDIEGNEYTTVVIGSQEWMVENFRCTKYADYSLIPQEATTSYSDWFLPSRDELNAMYTELKAHGVGGFADADYCSSSEDGQFTCWRLPSAATSCTVGMKGNGYSVKPIRAFTSLLNYNLRDVGPAGGLIFYRSGQNYLESSITDVSISQAFSDALVLLGTTDTAIGTGQANTTAIIGQVGHTDSAAKLCDDLVSGGWANDTNGSWCIYNNDIYNNELFNTYGILYNYFALTNIKGFAYLERNGIQEAGWRVPTYNDMVALSTALGGDSVSGGKLKESGTTHWNNPNTDADNESGLTVVPGGFRSHGGVFASINTAAYIGTLTEYPSPTTRYYVGSLNHDSAAFSIIALLKNNGVSIRLVRDI